MAAKDYQIACGLASAYIAKISKRSHCMTSDKKEISETEIIMLTEWYLEHELGEGETTVSFPSVRRKGKRIEVRFVDE